MVRISYNALLYGLSLLGVPGTLVFRGFPSHRVELMSQSVLSQNIDLITIKLLSEDHMEASFPDEPLAIHNLVVIGKQLEEFIWDFIFYKEKELAAVPACFMYHAAVSIPQSLVYAGELMCLLAGGKPLVMVQYTSPSDHQWKFPLVQKLTRGIVAAKEVLGDRLDIGYTVFSYGSEETLVLYRSSRKHLMESLR